MTLQEKVKKIKHYCDTVPVTRCTDCKAYRICPGDDRIALQGENFVDNMCRLIGIEITEENTDPPVSTRMEKIDEIRAMLSPEEYRGWLKGSYLQLRYQKGCKGEADWFLRKLAEVNV